MHVHVYVTLNYTDSILCRYYCDKSGIGGGGLWGGLPININRSSIHVHDVIVRIYEI